MRPACCGVVAVSCAINVSPTACVRAGECSICEAEGGRDGGLFTGETLLHIAIVQHDRNMVQYLLEAGADLDSRALGVFFQKEQVRRFTNEKSAVRGLFSNLKQRDSNENFRYVLAVATATL
jgi:hypothetical protein